MKTPKQAQQSMFNSGEDMPLFSGTPMTVKDSPFVAKRVAKQTSLLGDNRPVFGAGGNDVKTS